MTKILTDNENRVLACLRDKTESTENRNDGSKWGDVYLDNAVPHGMSIRQFDGTLGSLQKKGLYKDLGDCFGSVKLEAKELKQELTLSL